MLEGWGTILKVAGGAATCITACATGYVTIGGPIPASRQYVIAQNEKLTERLIDNSIQTNKLQLDLLRKEQIDRQVQIKQETSDSVKAIYMERLNAVSDGIAATVSKNSDLEHEKLELVNGSSRR
jgi:hypothetical protein